MTKLRLGLAVVVALALAVGLAGLVTSEDRAVRPDRERRTGAREAPEVVEGREANGRPRGEVEEPRRSDAADESAPEEQKAADAGSPDAALPPSRVVASGGPNGQGIYAGAWTIQPDTSGSGGRPRSVAVQLNTDSGSVMIGAGGPIQPGTSQTTGSFTTIDHSPDGSERRGPTTTSAGANVTVNEAAGSATGISTDIQSARQGTGGGRSSRACFIFKYEIDDCAYTVKICVDYPENYPTGRPTVTVSDGS